MFCGKCGAQVNEGEQFCSSCGAKMEAGDGSQQTGQEQQENVQQQGEAQQYSQPQYGVYQEPPKKKSLKALWISIAAVLVIAIAAVVLFVYPGVLKVGGGLLSGNTTQTKFVNDNVVVFANAFSGLDNHKYDNINKQPFDITEDITMSAMGMSQTGKVDIAYDDQTLGMTMNMSEQVVTMLLDGDVLYIQSGNETKALDLNIDTDLSKPMTLDARFEAIIKGILNKNISKSASKLDIKKLAELFVNSIDSKCFVTSGSKTTLTLKKQDIINLLNTFADGLEKDKTLKKSLEDLISDMTKTTVDVTEAITNAANGLEADTSMDKFSLKWEVSYENGAAKSISIMVDDGSGKGDSGFVFGYNKKSDGNELNFSITAEGQNAADGNIMLKKTAKGFDIDGEINASGQTMEFKGSEVFSDNKITLDFSMLYGGQEFMNVKYDINIKTGKPATLVKDDSRFKVDTQNATKEDISSLFGNLQNPSSLVPSLGN